MAAIFVLVIAIFGVLSVNTFSLRQALQNQNYQIANEIASTQLGLVESLLRRNFHANSSVIETSQDYEVIDRPGFSFAIKDLGYEDSPANNLRAVVVVVTWKEKEVEKSYELETTFYNY